MRRPAPISLADIRHPGPAATDRSPGMTCRADPISLELDGGAPLIEALGSFADQKGCGSAVLDLGGLALAPFDYVMPDRAIDDRHAAWYSDTRTSGGAVLDEAVAILGWKDGQWFAHIHACWHEGGTGHLGHLLPQTLATAEAARITGYGIKGAKFEAAEDPETEFTLFRVRPDDLRASTRPHNALITTLAPFADLHDSVTALAAALAEPDFEVFGLGSLAGAAFRETSPMTGLISEILVRSGAGKTGDTPLRLPIRGVDLEGTLHQGIVRPGTAPTLVTCELLIRGTAVSD
ncbi:hypothetical protein [Roseibium sp.]|uniref:hypothetical protein n=1 Tax=Roseibium sp. TaxID=1936156 RepID=UPI003264CE89